MIRWRRVDDFLYFSVDGQWGVARIMNDWFSYERGAAGLQQVGGPSATAAEALQAIDRLVRVRKQEAVR